MPETIVKGHKHMHFIPFSLVLDDLGYLISISLSTVKRSAKADQMSFTKL